MIPVVITASAATSAVTSTSPLAKLSFSQGCAIPIDTSGSAVVITAITGEIRVPDWKASWLSAVQRT
jgi:hypothetical protein